MGDRDHITRFAEQTMENATRHSIFNPTKMKFLEFFMLLISERCHQRKRCGIIFYINFLVHNDVELRVLFDFVTLHMTKDCKCFP